MAAPVIVLDGSQPYGTSTVTINGSVVIMDDINITRAVDNAEDRKANGAPNRARYTAGFDSMTATAQAPSGTAITFKFGDTFTLLVDDNYGTETWVIMPVNVQQTNDPTGVRKLPVTCRKVYNVTVTTVAS